MSRRSANFAAFPVLTQDSQGPQKVLSADPRQPIKSWCIRRLTYKYEFNNSKVALSRLGDTLGDIEDAQGKQPDGWSFFGVGWGNSSGLGASSANAKFEITTSRKPGLMPMFFQTKEARDVVFPAHKLGSIDATSATQESGIFVNSRQEFVIGPVFKKDATRDDIMAEVKVWADGYEFTFLRPLLEGKALSELAPSTQLEKDIVACLEGVLK